LSRWNQAKLFSTERAYPGNGEHRNGETMRLFPVRWKSWPKCLGENNYSLSPRTSIDKASTPGTAPRRAVDHLPRESPSDVWSIKAYIVVRIGRLLYSPQAA